MKRKQRSSGFSLIELMFVIFIILILITMLVPTLVKVKTIARRTECMTNLRAWANGISNYEADNRGIIPRSYDKGAMLAKIWSMKSFVKTGSSPTPSDYDEISLEKMEGYVSGAQTPGDVKGDIDFDKWAFGGAFACPSAIAPTPVPGPDQPMPEFANEFETTNGQYMAYSYFAGVKSWNVDGDDFDDLIDSKDICHGNDLTDEMLFPTRVLMADTFIYDKNKDGWYFNHGDPHPIWERGRYLQPGEKQSVENAEGMNILFGGGNVEWFGQTDLGIITPKEGENVVEKPDIRRYFIPGKGNTNLHRVILGDYTYRLAKTEFKEP